jgi:hypothetical protein
VECPDQLTKEAGASTRCTLTASAGTRFGVTVAIAEIDGDNAKLDIQVDDAPLQ